MHWSFRVCVPQPGPRCINAATLSPCSSMDDAAETGAEVGLARMAGSDIAALSKFARDFEAVQAACGGGRLKRVQCQGRTTEWTTGMGTAPTARTKTMAGATAATGAAECMTTQMGQWSASVAAGWTCTTWTKVTRKRSSRQISEVTDVARATEGVRPLLLFPRLPLLNFIDSMPMLQEYTDSSTGTA
jgi:hypothetical protein